MQALKSITTGFSAKTATRSLTERVVDVGVTQAAAFAVAALEEFLGSKGKVFDLPLSVTATALAGGLSLTRMGGKNLERISNGAFSVVSVEQGRKVGARMRVARGAGVGLLSARTKEALARARAQQPKDSILGGNPHFA